MPDLGICASCKKYKTIHARLSVQVGQKFETAAACRECFDNLIGNPALKGVLSAYLPEKWKGVLYGG